jgi:hypothetical protein
MIGRLAIPLWEVRSALVHIAIRVPLFEDTVVDNDALLVLLIRVESVLDW